MLNFNEPEYLERVYPPFIKRFFFSTLLFIGLLLLNPLIIIFAVKGFVVLKKVSQLPFWYLRLLKSPISIFWLLSALLPALGVLFFTRLTLSIKSGLLIIGQPGTSAFPFILNIHDILGAKIVDYDSSHFRSSIFMFPKGSRRAFFLPFFKGKGIALRYKPKRSLGNSLFSACKKGWTGDENLEEKQIIFPTKNPDRLIAILSMEQAIQN